MASDMTEPTLPHTHRSLGRRYRNYYGIARFRGRSRRRAASRTNQPPIHPRAAADVGFDLELRPGAEPCPVDLDVPDDALDVVAGFRERNALDPVDRIDADQQDRAGVVMITRLSSRTMS